MNLCLCETCGLRVACHDKEFLKPRCLNYVPPFQGGFTMGDILKQNKKVIKNVRNA